MEVMLRKERYYILPHPPEVATPIYIVVSNSQIFPGSAPETNASFLNIMLFFVKKLFIIHK